MITERIAVRMAEGMTVPEYLRGNVGDCMAEAIEQQMVNPYTLATIVIVALCLFPLVLIACSSLVSGRRPGE